MAGTHKSGVRRVDRRLVGTTSLYSEAISNSADRGRAEVGAERNYVCQLNIESFRLTDEELF